MFKVLYLFLPFDMERPVLLQIKPLFLGHATSAEPVVIL